MKRYRKPFFKTLFWHQNKWHKHGVLIHTMKVCYHLIKKGRYDLLSAGLFHDIGKPLVAYHDKEDIEGGCKDFSFTSHEEISYHIVKNYPSWLISDYNKDIIRYHYHIRGMKKAKERGQIGKYNKYLREWDRLTPEFRKDLVDFLVCDDKGKK